MHHMGVRREGDNQWRKAPHFTARRTQAGTTPAATAPRVTISSQGTGGVGLAVVGPASGAESCNRIGATKSENTLVMTVPMRRLVI